MTQLRTRAVGFNERIPLKRAGLEVSPFCVGMVREPEAIVAAYDAGINFFFLSADMHWPVYAPARAGLEMLLARPGVRDSLIIAGASYLTQPEFCWDPFVELRGEVKGLHRLDVLVIGGTYAADFLPRLDVYRQIVADGRIGARAIGASFHDRATAAAAIENSLVDIAFARYSPVHPGARRDLFPRVSPTRTTPLFNFKSTLGAQSIAKWAAANLSDEHWHPTVTDFYRFALSRPEIDGLLCSPSTPQEVAALAAAMEEGPLDEEEETYLLDLAALAEGRG